MKKHLLAALVAALVMLTACTVTPPGETPPQTVPANTPAETSAPPAETVAENENPLLLAEFQTADIMNGYGTEKVGEYGFIRFSKADMEDITSEQLAEFCEQRYSSALNWVWIMFEDGTGIHIGPMWSAQMEYGVTDAENAAFSQIGLIRRTWDNGSPSDYVYISLEELDGLRTSLETMLEREYHAFFSLDVDFSEDSAGYSVSVLIDDENAIETVENLINDLEDPRIAEISITAMRDGKLLGTNH